MTHFDVFNGDADGICALLQLRHAIPLASTLITGVKRDQALLKQVVARPGDQITVLDVAMEKNSGPLADALANGAEVLYVDHHWPGEIPDHPALTAIIDESPSICTSLLINDYLAGKFPHWAITGAFGDNLHKVALDLGRQLAVDRHTLEQLENLGTYINYNGYGSALEDLHFHPRDLFTLLRPYADPLDFLHEDRETFGKLENGFHQDMANAKALQPEIAHITSAVFMLPREPWSRRVSGVFGNALTNQHPGRAHAIVTENEDGTYVVSVRAPLTNRIGAGDLCKQFPTGGGRAAAAGINKLPAEALNQFIDAFTSFYQ